jgi:hypothetical protein
LVASSSWAMVFLSGRRRPFPRPGGVALTGDAFKSADPGPRKGLPVEAGG